MYNMAMESEAAQTKEKVRLPLLMSDRVKALFAYTANHIPIKNTVFLHGAFRDLCREYPELFPPQSFGRPGELVNSDSFSYALNTLQMENVIIYQFGRELSADIDIERLQRASSSRTAAFVDAGLPPPSEWQPFGQRFVELIEINQNKSTSDLLATHAD